MLYYKQPYRRQPIFYLLSILLALLGGTMLLGCEVAKVNPDPSRSEVEYLEGGIRYMDRMLREVKASEAVKEVIKQQIEDIKQQIMRIKQEKIEWQCSACTAYNSIEINLCKVCATLRPIDSNKEWVCKACTFINPLSDKTCGGCGSEAYDPTKDTKNLEEKEECPVCFEEDKLQTHGKKVCAQCKKAICEPCYQGLLKTKNKSCPLCRYQEY